MGDTANGQRWCGAVPTGTRSFRRGTGSVNCIAFLSSYSIHSAEQSWLLCNEGKVLEWGFHMDTAALAQLWQISSSKSLKWPRHFTAQEKTPPLPICLPQVCFPGALVFYTYIQILATSSEHLTPVSVIFHLRDQNSLSGRLTKPLFHIALLDLTAAVQNHSLLPIKCPE